LLLDPQDTSYPSKYVRKNAAFALGEMAFPHEDVVAALVALLRSDDSVHVRATAATAIGTHPTHPTRSVRQMSARFVPAACLYRTAESSSN
jgi:HEAT repeat protein